MRLATEAIRRLRERLLQQGESLELVRRDAGTAIASLLGRDGPLLERLDAVAAARLLGHPELAAAWADLIEVQATATERAADVAATAAYRRRAADIRRAIRQLWENAPIVS